MVDPIGSVQTYTAVWYSQCPEHGEAGVWRQKQPKHEKGILIWPATCLAVTHPNFHTPVVCSSYKNIEFLSKLSYEAISMTNFGVQIKRNLTRSLIRIYTVCKFFSILCTLGTSIMDSSVFSLRPVYSYRKGYFVENAMSIGRYTCEIIIWVANSVDLARARNYVSSDLSLHRI